MAVDNRELYALAADLGKMPQVMARKSKPIFRRTALEVKNGMQADLRESRHFKQVALSVDYDVTEGGMLGALSMSAEIGPNAERNSSAPLAGIAYFGGVNGGGGTVRDPVFHAVEQGSRMVGYIKDAAEGLL